MGKTHGNDGRSLTPVQRFFVGSKIFLTGGTGFIGILLLEKLLSSCPDISKVFMLVRDKKGKDVRTRMQEFFDNEVFYRVREQCPNFAEKIVAVKGDCELPGLGLRQLDSETLIREVTTPLFLGKYPNTYTFTKHIGEDVVRQEGGGLPVGIHRPSVVLSTYKEPLKGWNNSIYGPAGLMMAGYVGIVKTSPYDTEVKTNMVPADMVVNSIIAAAWDIGESFIREKDTTPTITVYNYDLDLDVTWGNYLYTCKKYALKYFSVKTMWYLDGLLFKSFFVYSVMHFFLHTIPGVIIDAVLVYRKKPPMMRSIYRKLYKTEKMLAYFKMNEWTFETGNLRGLIGRMSDEDKKIFYCDVKDFDWEESLEYYTLGLRIYLMKDPLETLPAGQKLRVR
ncbi:fatty acyl-CoA reductase wat-like [Anoplophora glabripennis]|uniref:fatty acyl-CoA reductase wat-like n=1 Tax=Anoplophora glabripennis TaxID=217634 RepID=UPI000C768E1F|nr:fatty acyl-CoA reductase wat-like [Anoplophora glabripennis]